MSGTWPTGWVAGDIVTAAEFKKGIGAIYDTTLAATAATIDITGIVADYAHLLLVLYGRGTTAAATITAQMRFNSDAAANYDVQQLIASATTIAANEVFAQTLMNIGILPAASAPANIFGTTSVSIPYYAGSANNKIVNTEFANKAGTASGGLAIGKYFGGWRSNAAINRITLIPSAGSFEIGTRATLYAKGA